METQQDQAKPEFTFQGRLVGHQEWVTSIVAGFSQKENEDSQLLISGSRDKTIIIWKLYEEKNEKNLYGVPFKQLQGHNHFVSDLALSNENCFAISSSWDKTLRLWDLRSGLCTKQFVGHKAEVFTVAFSQDNRQIISSGADKVIRLWNTLASEKYNSEKAALNHTDWVSSIRYSPQQKQKQQNFQPYFASVGWDGRLKIWNTGFTVRNTFKAHEGNINAVSISPNGKFIATGGRDKKLLVWDVTDLEHSSRDFDAGSQINAIAINPKIQWVAVGTDQDIKVWNLMSSESAPSQVLYEQVGKDEKKTSRVCTSLCWNSLGTKLFAGYNDGFIRVWTVNCFEQKN